MKCGGNKLCDNLKCKTCFEKSFASSDKAKYWSKENDVNPRQVFKSSNKKYLFDCDICNHSFSTRLDHVNNNRWCSYCSNKKLCGDLNCNVCLDKSFLSSDKAEFWSENNDISPFEIFLSTQKKYIFDCNKCSHSFTSSPGMITQNKWCPYCTNQKLCDNLKCDMCFNKSFASSEYSKYLTKNNTNPRKIFKSTKNKICEFECEKGHIFKARIDSISRGRWCPRCVNKTEEKLHKWLEDNCYNSKSQAKFEWCKSKTYLPFDFCLEDFKILIELDGPQHFKQISNWESPNIVQERDIYKMKLAIHNGYTIIRLLQEDVWSDNIDWKSYLSEKIYYRKKPKILFCTNNNEYKNHKILIS
ncbi:endonuclease [Moumouvirus goulette]|uniref:Endonuclease n=1 Tax=Moumouvirus goulette TaxID=1247379 RepID=M1PWC8_9VIRU|nr:endonuclease [Moumouvirus goulette]AGF85052.1 endonuclease [Moumouvirus goulette]